MEQGRYETDRPGRPVPGMATCGGPATAIVTVGAEAGDGDTVLVLAQVLGATDLDAGVHALESVRSGRVMRADRLTTLLARLDDEGGRDGGVVADADSWNASMRKLVRASAVSSSPTVRWPSPYGARRSSPDGGERVGHRQHERCARLEHPVDLSQRAAEVVVVIEGVVGDDEVDRAARGEAEVGEVAAVALDRDPGPRASPRRSAMRSSSGSTAIALAPSAARATALPAIPSSTTRRPPEMSPSRCSSSSPGTPSP